MKIVLLLAVLLGSALCIDRTFSVRIKGQFLCHDKPYPNLPLDIYHQASTMNYPDFMTRFASTNGDFDLTAYITVDEYMISPYIVIRHSCWENYPARCNRKLVWQIPGNKITNAKNPDEKKIFDVGKVDLAFKHPAEVKVICGAGI